MTFRKISHQTTILNERAFLLNRIFIGAIVLVVFLYVYFVNQAVINVAHRGSTEEAARDMQSRIVSLESDYLTRTGVITPEFALSQGFVETARLRYISRMPLGVSIAQGNGM